MEGTGQRLMDGTVSQNLSCSNRSLVIQQIYIPGLKLVVHNDGGVGGAAGQPF